MKNGRNGFCLNESVLVRPLNVLQIVYSPLVEPQVDSERLEPYTSSIEDSLGIFFLASS